MGCALWLGGIFGVVGLGCLALTRFAGDTRVYNTANGRHEPIGPTAFIVGVVFVAIAVGIILLGVLTRAKPAR
jgi:hypothetical protein